MYGSVEDSSTAVLAPEPAIPPAENVGSCCSNCETPMPKGQMVCQCCGFYPTMGIFVDVDSEWERFSNPEAAPPKTRRNPVEEFFSAVPGWAWTLMATNLSIVALCIAGKILIPSTSVVFEFWGVWQLTIGLAMFELLHVTCFFLTATGDATISLIDFIVNPMKAWFKTFARLPKRQWLVIGASNALTLAFTAAVIVGGVQWDRLWDWGIAPPAKSSLVSAVASAAANGPTNGKNLEESVQDFAGQAGNVDDSANKKPASPKEPPRTKTDCLVIGFELNAMDQVSKLYLAHETAGRLVYAGTVTPQLDEEQGKLLRAKLMAARTATPLLKVTASATWVKPRFPCRVSYTVQTREGKLRNLQLEELLPEINIPW